MSGVKIYRTWPALGLLQPLLCCDLVHVQHLLDPSTGLPSAQPRPGHHNIIITTIPFGIIVLLNLLHAKSLRVDLALV